MTRTNDLSIAGWRHLFEDVASRAHEVQSGLKEELEKELTWLEREWPNTLPAGVIHADLFPDNVFFLDQTFSGLIDFYFSCTDIRAYDLAVTHSAWCFSNDGKTFFGDRAAALGMGYDQAHGLTPAERAAFPILCRGAALRFLLTRAYDWINTPADALVTRKDPLAYLRRLDFYAKADPAELLGA